MNVVHQSNGKYRLDAKTTEDKIAGFFLGEIQKEELSDKEQRIMKRWVQIFTLKVSNFYSDFEAVKIHHQMCEENGEPIGGTTAFYDLQNATKVFGDATKTSKDAKRAIYEAWQTEVLKMAIAQGDITGFNRGMKNLIDMHELNKPSTDLPGRPEKPTQYILQINNYNKDPKTINLDEMGQIPEKDRRELLNSVESEEISVDKMEILLKEADEGESES